MDQPDLTSLEEDARVELDDKFAARERALSSSRKVIRSSANAIRSLHRGEFVASQLEQESVGLFSPFLEVVEHCRLTACEYLLGDARFREG